MVARLLLCYFSFRFSFGPRSPSFLPPLLPSSHCSQLSRSRRVAHVPPPVSTPTSPPPHNAFASFPGPQFKNKKGVAVASRHSTPSHAPHFTATTPHITCASLCDSKTTDSRFATCDLRSAISNLCARADGPAFLFILLLLPLLPVICVANLIRPHQPSSCRVVPNSTASTEWQS